MPDNGIQLSHAMTRSDPSKGIIHLSGYSGSHFAALADNSIHNNTAMGIFITDSQVLFYGSNKSAHNYAPYGGGIFIVAILS